MAVLVPPLRGSSRLSVEEGFVRSIAVDALDAVGYGRNVLYDQMLPRNAGIGRLFSFFPSTIDTQSDAAQNSVSYVAKPKKEKKRHLQLKFDPTGASSAILIAPAVTR